jgi:cytochrome b561
MRLRNSPDGYGAVPQALHWAVAVLVLPVFGLFDIASPWPADRAFSRSVREIHELLADAAMILAGIHAAAALAHHWLFRDRMLPSARK